MQNLDRRGAVARPERIDLLITDFGRPNGMNRRQVADATRTLHPGLRVLFITGYAENAAVGNGHLEPGMELLTKPFTIDALSLRSLTFYGSAGLRAAPIGLARVARRA